MRTGYGIELVRALAAEGERIFTVERARDLAPAVGVSDAYLLQALHYATEENWLVRLRKGLYAISSSVPGAAPAHEFEIAMFLVNPAAISHWSAMNFHGLTDQTPRKVYILTTTAAAVPRNRSAKKSASPTDGFLAGDAVFQFVQTRPEKFFGFEKVWVGEARIQITDPERTLLDGLSAPRHCGDFAEVLHAFEMRRPKLNVNRIVDYAIQLDAAAAKRLGWVLEKQGVSLNRLKPLARVPVKGYRKLDASGPGKGPCNRRWMIQENLPGRTVA